MKFETILVPTDFSPNAQRALSVAQDLAAVTGGSLHVLHVSQGKLRTAVNEGLMRPGMPDAEIDRAARELTECHLAETISGIPAGMVLRRDVLYGNPRRVIVDFARRIKADLIVAGLRGRSARNTVRSALMGSVAATLVRRAPCPVLVVPPEPENNSIADETLSASGMQVP